MAGTVKPSGEAARSYDKTETIQPEDREAAASCIARWTFCYFSSLVSYAAKNKKLEIPDCWRHGPKPADVYARFEMLWKEELKKPTPPSLVHCLWVMSRRDFFYGGACWGLAQLFQILQPIFLQQIVRFVEIYSLYGHGDQCRASADAQDRHLCDPRSAAIIPAIFVLVVACQSLLQQRATQANLRLALQFRTITVAGIMRKSMRLSSIGAGSSSAGQVSNLVSNDAQQIVQFAPLMHMAWTAPLVLIFAFVMLAYAVGACFLVGVAVLLFLGPLIVFSLKKAFKYRAFMVKATDARVKLINDVLLGLRVIKAYGWETAIIEKVRDTRRTELRWNAKRSVWTSIMITTVFSAPVLNAIAIFAVYSLTGGEFIASRIFMALATLNTMRFALIMGPFVIIQWANCKIAMIRMQSFMLLDEVPQSVIDRPCAVAFTGSTAEAREGGVHVAVEDASAAWAVREPPPAKGKGKGKGCAKCCFGKRPPRAKGEGKGRGESPEPEEDPLKGKNIVLIKKGDKDVKLTQVLFKVSFRAEPGELTAVIGPIGSGKSSLLQCLMGEMEMLSGTASLKGTCAYVAQQAFILNATIKENITLTPGPLSPEKEELFAQVLEACALEDDLALLPGRELTEIGERGVNLSGGQKQRISLARACFSGADIVLLDDPLSAVDAHVGKHLMEQVIGARGLLAGKTRIFVTHQLQHLEKAHDIYMLEDGMVVHRGDFATLTAQGHMQVEKAEDETNESGQQEKEVSTAPRPRLSLLSDATKDQEKAGAGALVMQEEREEGELKTGVLAAYIKAGGTPFFLVWVVALVLQMSSQLCTEGWLAAWASGEGMGVQRADNYPLEFWIGIYTALGLFQAFFLFLRNIILLVYHTRIASQNLHDSMIFSVFRGKMVFFDKNPLGRILNRFTRDIEYIDVILVQSLSQFINTIAGTMGALIMICIIYPFFLALAAFMIVVYHLFTKYFRNVSRELQRLESVTRSPIFSLLSESQGGLVTIRGFAISPIIVDMADKALDVNTGIFYLTQTCAAWLQLRLDVLALLVLLGVTLLPTLKPDFIGPGYVGLAITYAFELNMLMKHAARMSAEVEQKFNAVDRVIDYSENIESEAEWVSLKDATLAAEWPSAGKVRFSDVVMSYRPGLEPALRGISFDIAGGEKVGICGRTGSGKSSLIVAMLRITEYRGLIEVDGFDLQQLGLHAVRQKISMIPQDPVLFCASLRSNLDPLEEAGADSELEAALGLVRLREEVEKHGGLDFGVAEGGQNFSVGQRQLLCLARAVLRRSRLVLLDEATASVDPQSDELIQKTIRKEFKTSTVITIAHRLNTILDSDKILILDSGVLGEFGTPTDLARDENSRFHKLLKKAGCNEFLQQARGAPADGPGAISI